METLVPGGCVNQDKYNALRINVGFLLHQSVGYKRKFEIDESFVQIESDLDVYDLFGDITFTRTSQGLYSQSDMTARTPLECVRCLSKYDQELTIEINGKAFSESGKFRTCDKDPNADHIEAVLDKLIIKVAAKITEG